MNKINKEPLPNSIGASICIIITNSNIIYASPLVITSGQLVTSGEFLHDKDTSASM